MKPARPPRKQFEARLIQLLKWRFEKSNLRVFDYQKVGKLPLEIDAVVVSSQREWTPDFTKFPRLFDYFRQHNIIEVKTEQDRLKIDDVPKVLAYGWLYMAQKQLTAVPQVTVTALVHHLSAAVKAVLPQFGFESISKGIYRRDADMVGYVIIFSELPEEFLPEELRAFTDSEKRRQTLLACLSDYEKAPIAETIFDLYESEVKKLMPKMREETLLRILSFVPPQKFVAALGAEKVISLLGDKRIISTLGDKRILSALGDERIVAALGQKRILAALLKNEKLLKALRAKINTTGQQKISRWKTPKLAASSGYSKPNNLSRNRRLPAS